jgi:peptidoglycan hydrolase-like protein with peptidoglycan-binding domain
VPRRATRGGRAAADRDGAAWGRWDIVAVTLAAVTTVAILVNVLVMQSGPQSAPIKGALKPTAARPATTAVADAPAPRPRPADPTPAAAAPPAAAIPPGAAASPGAASAAPTATPTAAPTAAPRPAARMPGEIINDIQRELVRRGFYDGVADGLYGPKTDSAIRDFEQANGLKPSTEPSEALLAAIVRAAPKPAARTTPVVSAVVSPVRPPLPVRSEAERPAASRRVIALQRALADYGYGQIRPSGFVDGETQAAIEKFERERRLPVTGQPSDRVVRELAAMTGRPLE